MVKSNKLINLTIMILLGMVYFVSVIPYSIRVFGLVLVFILLILSPIIGGKRYIKGKSIILIWALAFAIIAISMLFHHLDQFYLLFYFCMILLLFMVDENTYFMFKIVDIVMVMGVFYAIMTIIQVLFKDFYITKIYPMLLFNSTFDSIRYMRFGIYSGFTYQTAVNALYLALGMGATLCSFFYNNKARMLKLFIIGVEAICIMMSAKRGHLFFSVFGLLIIIYYAGNRGKRLRNSIIFLLIVFFTLLISLNTVPAVSFFVNKVFSVSDDITNGRAVLYKEALSIFRQHPVLGIGWNQFRYSYIEYKDVHNIYLQLLCETGIIGTIVFITAFSTTLFYTIKSLKLYSNTRMTRGKYLLLFSLFCQVFFLMYGFTGNPLYDFYAFAFYFIGCIIAIRCPKGDSLL